MNWQIYLRDQAQKELKRLPNIERERIQKIIDEMEREPFSGDIEKLKGEENVWRRRIGVYRIRYKIHDSQKIIYIFNIERRTSNTY